MPNLAKRAPVPYAGRAVIRRQKSTSGPLRSEPFTTTHWSVVVAAGQAQSGSSAEAMDKLCQAYWYPLYAFTRQLGHRPHDAQDLTQAFFLHLLQSKLVEKAQRERGRFRSFLLSSLKNFILTEWTRARAQKRGGERTFISLDEEAAEGRFANEPACETDPEILYEKAWAITVLAQALELLESEQTSTGKGQQFEKLKVFLQGEKVSQTYAVLAAEIGTSESAVKMMVQRLRQRYRECLRAVVARTVITSAEIDEELHHLVQVLAG